MRIIRVMSCIRMAIGNKLEGALRGAVPSAVVLRVDVDCMPVRVHGRRRILKLHELVTHQRPRGEEMAIEFERAPEVSDRLLVLRLERVVVADHAAGLGPVPARRAIRARRAIIARRAIRAIEEGIEFITVFRAMRAMLAMRAMSAIRAIEQGS